MRPTMMVTKRICCEWRARNGSRCLPRAPWPVPSSLFAIRDAGQAELKGGTRAGIRASADLAAMAVNNRLANGQAHANRAWLGGIKGFEKLLRRFAREPATRILHRHGYC